jgi:hypothetical protein
MSLSNISTIFGLTREEVTIAGLPMQKRLSLKPVERVWFQENSEASRNEWNESYLAFADAVKDKLKYKTQEEAYHAVKEYYRGTLDAELSDKIELLSLSKPLKRDKDIDELELTFFINSRLVKDKFPKEEFLEAFGLAFVDEWTIEHTRATAEIHDELQEFFASEAAGKVKTDTAAGK